jgi:hypothetical protein
MAGTPIEITLYAADDAPIKTYTKSIVPWGILKKAIRLAKVLDVNNMSETDFDELTGFVIAAFGDQFGMADLEKGADVTDMVSVLTMIMAKAGALMPSGNPTPPG